MGICELHKTEMKERKVPISYGLSLFDAAWEVQSSLFPNANSFSLGGCVMSVDNPSHVLLECCDECREAERKWRAAISAV